MPLPADQPARDRALSPRQSFHLEAPAGSGKTSVILARFLALLSRVETPEELLALTFTRKAAGELRARVMALLWEKEAPGPEASPMDLKLRELAAQVFQRHGDGAQLTLAPERLPIMTFHSFCAQLLKLAPQEALVPLNFQLLEEVEARWLKEEALTELHRRLNARSSQDPVRQAMVRRLVRLNNDWQRLGKELLGLMSRRDSLGDFLELARVSREPERYLDLLEDRFHLALLPSLVDLRAGVAASELGSAWHELWTELQGSSQGTIFPPALPGAAPQDLAFWQAVSQVLLTKQGEPRKQLTVKQGFPVSLDQGKWAGVLQKLPAATVKSLKQCRDLTATGASPDEAAALQDLVILLGEALSIHDQLSARKQALDFVALEQAALKLLEEEDPAEILLRLDWRLKHILVDEFQDTSQNQMNLLCRLISGWQGEGGRTLVVVGDPKQSIYGWRQAKPRLFQESRQGLPCPSTTLFPLEPLLLETNFRATRTLITWANEVFGRTIMKDGTSEADFHRALPRPDAEEGPIPRLVLVSGGTDLVARETEGRWLAGEVASALASLKNQETIGILLFTRRHLPCYLRALHEAGLSARVKEGLKLADSPAVAHLHNLARALVRPQDDVAWAGVLRGPWGAQSLQTLAQVAQTQTVLWPGKLRDFAQHDGCSPELRDLLQTLLRAQEQVGRRPLADIVSDWLNNTGAWRGIAAREGALGVANARTYLELLATAESGGPETSFLKADFALQEAFQPPDPRAQDSPVEIMTVHGAKGLEFHQVFLPHLDWQPLKSEDQTPPFLLEEIPGSRHHGLALARPYIQEKPSSLYLLLSNIKNRRILDEARRVFYVAVTRAREGLVLSGIVKEDSRGKWLTSGESPLRWLRDHYRLGLPVPGGPKRWPDPEIEVQLLSAVVPLGVEKKKFGKLGPAWNFYPEAAPYQISFPSQLAIQPENDRISPSPENVEDPETARRRGQIIHRGLETLAKGGKLPDAVSLAAALRQEGMEPAAATILAPKILAELRACREDPFLRRLLGSEMRGVASEWLLEDQPVPGTIRRGKVDHLAFDGKTWWLLDFKTARPAGEEDWEGFIAREVERYRPQLLAYREMAAEAKVVNPGAIRIFFYFTACQRAVEV